MDRLGSYRLRKRLAVGGMGEVYLGEKIGPEGFVKPVVLKCVLPQLASDRAFVKLFEDEARLAALLNHPNIAQVYDFGLVDNTYYIAMEYVPGYTVDDIRRKLKSIGQFLPLKHVACIASQVCQGLHYAHTLTDGNGVSLGLVHRDVSPHNLIVSVGGGVKLVDFGIAKARAGVTRVQAKGAVGKFGYMSPEQARGEPVDGRSDVFSLGVCLWELLTNERLHDPNLDRAPAYSPTRPIRSVEEFRTDLPGHFLEILERVLAIQPEDRFQTAQELHLQLERFLAAMTHYAGNSALAEYIKDLADGRVENPEQRATGEVVQAVDPVRRPATQRPTRTSMDEAEQYERVFGVRMTSKRPRPTRNPPKSWDTTAPPAVPVAPPTSAGASSSPAPALEAPGRLVDLSDGTPGPPHDDRVPELDLDYGAPAPTAPAATNSVRPAPPSPPRRPAGGGGLSLGFLAVVVILAALAGSAYAFRDRLGPLAEQALGRLQGAGDADAPGMNSQYRVESKPVGATVYLDGQRQPGATPVALELIPGVEHLVEVRHQGRATAQRTVTAEVHEGQPVLSFELEPAGRLKVSSVPSGAIVTVDGREAAGRVTPMLLTDVPAGRPVRVRIRVKGLPPQERTVTIPPGKLRTVTVEL